MNLCRYRLDAVFSNLMCRFSFRAMERQSVFANSKVESLARKATLDLNRDSERGVEPLQIEIMFRIGINRPGLQACHAIAFQPLSERPIHVKALGEYPVQDNLNKGIASKTASGPSPNPTFSDAPLGSDRPAW
jgi:hypothetical protein